MADENEVLQQDLGENDYMKQGAVFVMHLLMEEKCEMPDKDFVVEVMKKHLGNVDCYSYDTSAGFALLDHMSEFKDGKAPAMLMFTECIEIEKPVLNELESTQLWDCQNADEILESCKYQVIANDMLAAGLEYSERAEMLVDYIEALAEIFPTCKAFVFGNSGKMHSREAILECDAPKSFKFIHYAVNARFFNIQGTDDKMIDTIGMNTLFLPDLQFHFHGLDPNDVVNYTYSMLSYIYDKNNPIKSGDSIDGLKDGRISMEVQWKAQYENSLIQPLREVIDINMGEFASGNRG